jgi:glycosyltransferase involved in cell wall biosynthesis
MAVQIGIDSRSLRTGPPGVATVVQNLLEHIRELVPFDRRFPTNNFLWNQLRVPVAVLRGKWDLYHAPSYTAPLLIPCPLILSVYDVSYLASEEWYPYKLDRFRRRYYVASMKRADRILVPSDFTRQEVIRFLPALEPRIRKVVLGVSAEFRRDVKISDEVRRKLKLPDRFLLHVGDIHPRRNIEQILAAVSSLDLPLVLVGRQLVGAAVEAHNVYCFTGVSQRDLIGLYNAATALVYPSVYEGFGLPVLEAMACGLPVVAANRASIPEVCGDAAVLVEPEAEAIQEGLQRLMERREDYAARGLERVRRFSWEETAQETFRVYEELL